MNPTLRLSVFALLALTTACTGPPERTTSPGAAGGSGMDGTYSGYAFVPDGKTCTSFQGRFPASLVITDGGYTQTVTAPGWQGVVGRGGLDAAGYPLDAEGMRLSGLTREAHTGSNRFSAICELHFDLRRG